MLSDESSSDSETGRFKCQSNNQSQRANDNNHKRDTTYSRSSGSRRPDERLNRDRIVDRKRDERERYERRSRERHRYARHSPVRKRHSKERSRDKDRSRDRSRNRRSPDRYKDKHARESNNRSKHREARSNSRDKYRRSRSKSIKSPIKVRNIKDEIKDVISSKDKNLEKNEAKIKNDTVTLRKSLSPEEKVNRSILHKPATSETQMKVSSPILIEHESSDASDVVQPGSYYNMIPAIVKDKSEESSEIDSSDDEKLRAKLLNLEKELQKTKKKKHKKKHKRKSSKADKDKQESLASVEVSSTTDIQEAKPDDSSKIAETEVTSTQKSNQKESSEEGEILSDDNSQSDYEIDPNDLRHKLKRSKMVDQDKNQKLDICGPALPPHLEKRFKKSVSPEIEGPMLPPHLKEKSRNIGPSIPENMRKVLAENSEVQEIEYESSDDDGIGPLPAGAEDKWSDAHQRLEERAMEMKIKSLDGQSLQTTNVKSREKWMLELPEGKTKYLGLEARTFRAKEGPDMSDRSSWTDTPEDKARKALGIAKEEDANATLQEEARTRYIESRDDEQEKAVKKHKKKHKRDESLLEMHQKKLKKKKKKDEKDGEKKERRPFSRDVDLAVNRFDEAQKKSIIKKAQGLNSRFSSGEAKYL